MISSVGGSATNQMPRTGDSPQGTKSVQGPGPVQGPSPGQGPNTPAPPGGVPLTPTSVVRQTVGGGVGAITSVLLQAAEMLGDAAVNRILVEFNGIETAIGLQGSNAATVSNLNTTNEQLTKEIADLNQQLGAVNDKLKLDQKVLADAQKKFDDDTKAASEPDSTITPEQLAEDQAAVDTAQAQVNDDEGAKQNLTAQIKDKTDQLDSNKKQIDTLVNETPSFNTAGPDTRIALARRQGQISDSSLNGLLQEVAQIVRDGAHNLAKAQQALAFLIDQGAGQAQQEAASQQVAVAQAEFQKTLDSARRTAEDVRRRVLASRGANPTTFTAEELVHRERTVGEDVVLARDEDRGNGAGDAPQADDGTQRAVDSRAQASVAFADTSDVAATGNAVGNSTTAGPIASVAASQHDNPFDDGVVNPFEDEVDHFDDGSDPLGHKDPNPFGVDPRDPKRAGIASLDGPAVTRNEASERDVADRQLLAEVSRLQSLIQQLENGAANASPRVPSFPTTNGDGSRVRVLV